MSAVHDGHFGLEIAFSLSDGLMVKVKAQRESHTWNVEMLLDELFADAKARVLSTLEAGQ
jgi:hypothetical protein